MEQFHSFSSIITYRKRNLTFKTGNKPEAKGELKGGADMIRKSACLLVTLLVLFCACAAIAGVSDLKTNLKDTPILGKGGGSDSATSGVVMADVGLNVRTGPWGDVVGVLQNGAVIKILGKEGAWYKIDYNGETRYVHSGYVATEAAPTSAFTGYVNTENSFLNVRSGPWGNIIGRLDHGAGIDILGKSGDWYIISYNGQQAYIHSDYIQKSPTTSNPALPPPGNNDPADPNGFGGRPVSGGPVTSEFGPRQLYGNFHYGIDIGVPTGTPAFSLGSGTVSAVGWDNGGGRYVDVKYSNGYKSRYYHLKDVTVSQGQKVNRGQLIAHTNNTGAYTTGPHIHCEITNPSGTKVNPRTVPGLKF
jgi:uncharacterized protein YraI